MWVISITGECGMVDNHFHPIVNKIPDFCQNMGLKVSPICELFSISVPLINWKCFHLLWKTTKRTLLETRRY